MTFLMIMEIMMIHLAALLWHRAGEQAPNGWLHRNPEVAQMPTVKRYLRALYWATVTTTAVGCARQRCGTLAPMRPT
jgi:hypothetical protein